MREYMPIDSLLISFIQEHQNDDISRLLLSRDKWPEVDLALAAECIESRRKLRDKCPRWAESDIICPLKLSAEQCSSERTAAFKAEIAESLGAKRIADLTSGLGVDCSAFARVAEDVLYNEMKPQLLDAAAHNFASLGISNIQLSGEEISTSNIGSILESFLPDLVFMDPARRSESGSKVFKLADCAPNVVELKDAILAKARLMVKLSPMADISQVCRELGNAVSDVYVVEALGECKELLIVLDCESHAEPTIHTVELSDDGKRAISFKPSDEANAKAITVTPQAGMWLFEPGKALMKSGAYKLLSGRFGMGQAGKNAHIYFNAQPSLDLEGFGRALPIREVHPLNKRSMADVASRFPNSEVIARGLPLSSDALRTKMKLHSGNDARIYALGTEAGGNILVIA